MNIRTILAMRGARSFRLSPVLAAALLRPAALPAADRPAPAAPAPDKPYTLYLGADLSIEKDGRLWPVEGVERNSFVIDVDGRRVPVRNTELKLKIDSTVKMTTAYATLDDLKAERAYTPGNDPRHHVREAMAVAEDASANVDLAVASLNELQSRAGREAANPVDPREGAPSFSVTQADLNNAAGQLQRSLGSVGSEVSSVPDAIFREQVELDRQLFDAFSLSFKISCPRPLTDPYLVVMVRFREKPDDPKTGRILVYAQVLPAINDRPEEVRLFRGGFPLGYGLEGYRIHVYDHGHEVATTAAEKQMAMTTDEAFQFTVADYGVRNRDRTLPPEPAKAFWPRNLAQRLPVKELDRVLYAKVGRDGRVAGFYADADCRRPLRDADLDAVRPDLHFYPALQKGRAIDAVVAFNLGQRIE